MNLLFKSLFGSSTLCDLSYWGLRLSKKSDEDLCSSMRPTLPHQVGTNVLGWEMVKLLHGLVIETPGTWWSKLRDVIRFKNNIRIYVLKGFLMFWRHPASAFKPFYDLNLSYCRYSLCCWGSLRLVWKIFGVGICVPPGRGADWLIGSDP